MADHEDHDRQERAEVAAPVVEERGDAVVDAALDEPRHGQARGDGDRDQQRRQHERPVVRAHEVAEQVAAPRPEETGQPAGDLLDVFDVDASPLVDQLVTRQVEGGVGIDVVDLVRFDGGHGTLTSLDVSASSDSTAR